MGSCVETLDIISRYLVFCLGFQNYNQYITIISTSILKIDIACFIFHLYNIKIRTFKMAKEKAKHLLSKCFGESEETREQKRINKEIEKQLSKDRLLSSNSIKLLLLGTAESGKSTFVKQMRIIHGDGYSKDEKQKYATIISRNIIVALQSLIRAINTLQIPYSDSTTEENAESVLSIDFTKIASPGNGYRSLQCSQMMETIKALWKDRAFRRCCEDQDEYHISDSISYYLSRLDRISREEYIPTDQDILRCRIPTSGVTEYSFDIHFRHFRLVDVGGQKTERRKWIHCFEGVTSVLFLAALSDYNEKCQILRENETEPEKGQNRLDISISLFKIIKHNPWFQNSSMILFLNKKDLFEEKINSVDLTEHWPEYEGGPRNAIAARNFIQDKFCEKVDDNDNTTVYSHFTCATDTNNMRFVFESVRNTILEQNIKEYFY